MLLITLANNPYAAFGQSLAINEFCSANTSLIADEDGDYEDWIELYNYGTEDVDLRGFFLSDDTNDPQMWAFPTISIASGEHMIIWASGKNRRLPDYALHTNFRLARSGEPLLLTGPDGRVDEVWPTALLPDISFARYPDGTGAWNYSMHPTPGANNAPMMNNRMLIYYWFFDTELPNNTSLESIEPRFAIYENARLTYTSSLPGYPYSAGHDLWRKASMERRNQPTSINYRPLANNNIPYEESEIRGIQIKPPFGTGNQTNTITLHVPMAGFKDPVLRFAAINEEATGILVVEYNTSQTGGIWNEASRLNTTNFYREYEVDFQGYPVGNHDDLKIRIRFEQADQSLNDGKRITFNNISIDATPIKSHYINIISGSKGMTSPFGFNRVYQGETMTIHFYPSQNFIVDDVLVDQVSVKEMLIQQSGKIVRLDMNEISGNLSVLVTFSIDPEHINRQSGRILAYPNPVSDRLTLMTIDDMELIRIYNVSGNLIREYSPESSEVILDISDLRAGIYVLRILTDQRWVGKKILKIH